MLKMSVKFKYPTTVSMLLLKNIILQHQNHPTFTKNKKTFEVKKYIFLTVDKERVGHNCHFYILCSIILSVFHRHLKDIELHKILISDIKKNSTILLC